MSGNVEWETYFKKVKRSTNLMKDKINHPSNIQWDKKSMGNIFQEGQKFNRCNER